MNAATVSFDDVINAIRRGNSTVSAGNVEGNGLRRNLRVVGEIQNPEDLKQFVIKNQNGTVYMGDIASIRFRQKEKNSYARSDGKEAIVLDIKKRSGKNLIKPWRKSVKLSQKFKPTISRSYRSRHFKRSIQCHEKPGQRPSQ